MNKKLGGPRFTGRGLGKFDPKPGSIAFYKANIPHRFNKIADDIHFALGLPEDKAGRDKSERFAANVLRRSESSIQFVIDSGSLDQKDRCHACGFNLKHTDKPFPKWDKEA